MEMRETHQPQFTQICEKKMWNVVLQFQGVINIYSEDEEARSDEQVRKYLNVNI